MSNKNVTANIPAETETVFLPRVSGEESTVFVALNGRAWQIPRGKKVEVPAVVARVLDEAEHNARIANEFAKTCQQAG